MRTDAWELFKSQFKEDDEVIAIMDNGRVVWGKLGFDDDGISLGKGKGIASVKAKWTDIRFLAHDGFPVKKVMCPPTDDLLDKLDTTDTQKFIRNAIDYTVCGRCPKLIKEDSNDWLCPDCRKKIPKRAMGFGHPFLIEDVSAILINKGNTTDFRFVETIVLESRDGAIAHLWDLESIFYFE